MTSLSRKILPLLLFVTLFGHGQEARTLFGFQFKPILVTDIGDAGKFQVFSEEFEVDVNPRTGYAYGMLIQTDLTKKITLETGINRIQRRYEYVFRDTDLNESRLTNFGFVNYEIPVKALVYIQLGEDLFMDGALGAALDMYASDVSSGDLNFRQETYRNQWIRPALEASLGLEYRTKNSGFFYFGSTFHNPFGETARSLIRYEPTPGDQHRFDFGLNSAYLTFDIRYFFPENEKD